MLWVHFFPERPGRVLEYQRNILLLAGTFSLEGSLSVQWQDLIIVRIKIHSTRNHCTILYSTVLYCTIMYSVLLSCSLLFSPVLYCTLLNSTVLYCTLLYSTVLYCTILLSTVLCCTLLYSTVLYCTQLSSTAPLVCQAVHWPGKYPPQGDPSSIYFQPRMATLIVSDLGQQH